MTKRQMTTGLLQFTIENRNSGLSKEKTFEIFWRFNGCEYEVYTTKNVAQKVFNKMWNDKDVLLLSKNNS
jgi:hypothetical protein